MKPLLTLLALFLFVSQGKATDLTDDLQLYWSFNNLATTPSFFKPSITPKGYSGSGIRIGKQPIVSELDLPIQIRKNFSVALWFRPEAIESGGTILELGDGDNALSLSVSKQTIACSINGQKLEHYPYMIVESSWVMAALSYDGQFLHLTLFSDQISSTSHFKLPNANFNKISGVTLGSSGKAANGDLDELMIYTRPLTVTDIDQIISGSLPQEQKTPTANLIAQDYTSSPTVNPLPEKKAETDEVFVEAFDVKNESLILDIQDLKKMKGKFDVLLNNKRVFSGLTSNIGMPMLTFERNQTNLLQFVPIAALDEPLHVRAILWDGPKQIHRLNTDLESNKQMYFQINHHDDKMQVTEIQHTVEVKTRNIKIEIWDDRILDGDFISAFCNGHKLVDYEEITKEAITCEFTIETDKKNIVTFVSEDEGKYGNNSARVRIYDDGTLSDEFQFNSTLLRRAGLLIQYRHAEHDNE